MRAIVISDDNYTYTGEIADGEPHGEGIFYYKNGDEYKGSCKHSRPDGYGIYKFKSGGIYQGFHSFGKSHGIGTYEDSVNIYKGHWRNNKKHGIFYRTKKAAYKTYKQKWINGRKIKSELIQYIRPESLYTNKSNPKYVKKQRQITFKHTDKKCIGCLDKPMSACNTACGHVVMCYECLQQCENCPICRCPFEKVIKLFIN